MPNNNSHYKSPLLQNLYANDYIVNDIEKNIKKKEFIPNYNKKYKSMIPERKIYEQKNNMNFYKVKDDYNLKQKSFSKI